MIVFLLLFALGQQPPSISGVVTDPSGAVIAGAAVTVTSADSRQDVVSGADGTWTVSVKTGSQNRRGAHLRARVRARRARVDAARRDRARPASPAGDRRGRHRVGRFLDCAPRDREQRDLDRSHHAGHRAGDEAGRSAARGAGVQPVPPHHLRRRQSDHAGSHAPRAVGVGRQPHAGRVRRRPAERSVWRMGLLGSRARRRAAAGGRGPRRVRRSARKRRARRRDPADHANGAGRRSLAGWRIARHRARLRLRRALERHLDGRGVRRNDDHRRLRGDRSGSPRPDRRAGQFEQHVGDGLGRGDARHVPGDAARRLFRRGPRERHAGADQRDHHPLVWRRRARHARGRLLGRARRRQREQLSSDLLRGDADQRHPHRRAPDQPPVGRIDRRRRRLQLAPPDDARAGDVRRDQSRGPGRSRRGGVLAHRRRERGHADHREAAWRRRGRAGAIRSGAQPRHRRRRADRPLDG